MAKKIKIKNSIFDKEIDVIFSDHSRPTENFIKIIISRIRTQRRAATKYGGIDFDPPLISAILELLGDKDNIFDKWMEKTINSVYFLVGERKVYLKNVKKIHFQRDDNYKIPCTTLPYKIKIPIVLSEIMVQKIASPKVYCVKIQLKKGLCPSRTCLVNLGDKLNIAQGIEDVTLDHVVPIRQVLDDNINQLPCLAKISYIKGTLKSKKVATICSMITPNDSQKEGVIRQIQNELNLIVEKTKGIRICAKRVN